MINIPDPCKEDFSKMTPTERGAFCNKCQTDTFDFRHLSPNQINGIIKQHKGEHICGRFTKNQLDELNNGFLNWKNQSKPIFQSKFLLACVMVFGLTLFSCNSEDKAVIENMNTIEMTKNADPVLNFINKEFDLKDIDLLDFVVEEQILEPFLECGNLEEEIAGDIAYTEEYKDHVQLAGMIAYDPTYIDYVELELPDTVEESILEPPIEIDQRIFEASAYPNPTQINSTIALDIEKEGQFDIMMYNMNGQLIQNIHSGILSEGRQQFEVEMYDLNSGMYIVKVISQGQEETLKIQKVN
jgi:hypothetical protein